MRSSCLHNRCTRYLVICGENHGLLHFGRLADVPGHQCLFPYCLNFTMTDSDDNSTLAPTTAATAAPALPDRLAVDPRSPHHNADVFAHDIGIRLNGKERFDVEEYCVSEGWVKVPASRTRDRHGRPLMLTLKGAVEAFYK